jgi:hypothetical protein
MRAAYDDFVSLTDPIVTHNGIDGMVNECEIQLPHLWKQLQAILGFDNSFKETNNSEPKLAKEHLIKFYWRMTFYELMALSRVRNSHHFVNWACILAAVMYGQSNIDVSRTLPTYFVFLASLTTLSSKTTELGKLKAFYEKLQQSLQSKLISWRDDKSTDHVHKVVIACYDNSQKNTKFKFQRDGKTSNFVKVTARMFLKIWQGSWQSTILPNRHVPINYVDQIIPSPIGMPPFEVAKAPTQLFLTSNRLGDIHRHMFELHHASTVDCRC